MLEYRFAQLTLLATLFLLFVGATVHPTGSSLACPEWLFVPTCNYELTPEMKGGVLYEHGHRLAAFLVGLFTVGLALLTWRRRKNDRTTRILALVAVVGVVLQGALGGLTVLLGLSPAISIAHLALAMGFFSLVLVITHRLRPQNAAGGRASLAATAAGPGPGAPARVASARKWAAIATLAVFVQIVLGALVRHTGSALQCLDIPLCGGELWPEGGLAQIHMVHRFGGVIAGLLVLFAAHAAMRAARGRVRVIAVTTTVLLVAQIVLGIYSVLSFIAIPVVVAHLVVGALLLAGTLATYLHLGDAMQGFQREERAPRLHDERRALMADTGAVQS